MWQIIITIKMKNEIYFVFFRSCKPFFFIFLISAPTPPPPPPPPEKIMVPHKVYSTRHYGLILPRDSYEDRKLGVIVSLLQVYRVWLLSALTLSRGTSKCIVGFQATNFANLAVNPTRLAKRSVILRFGC